MKHLAAAVALAPDVFDDDTEFDEAIELSAERAGELARGLTEVAQEFPHIVCPRRLTLSRTADGGMLVEDELARWIIRAQQRASRVPLSDDPPRIARCVDCRLLLSEYPERPPEYWVMHVTSIIPDDGAPYQIKVVNGPYPTLAPAWASAGRIRKFKPDLIFIAGDLVAITMISTQESPRNASS